MVRARKSEAEELEERRRERSEGGSALVDMRIDIEFGDDVLLTVGGRWDRRLASYDPLLPGSEMGDPNGAQDRVVFRPHAGQVPVLVWWLKWMIVHAQRRDNPPAFDEAALARIDQRQIDPAEVFSAMLAGARRSGKTRIAVVICAIYAIAFPGAIIWIVNPTDSKHDEVRRYMSLLLSHDWIARETRADGWELINGSAIMLKSAYAGTDPDAIKEGEAHVVVLNEAQKIVERVFVVARGAVVDKSGIVLCCANPPVETKDQPWVGDFASDAQANRRAAVYFHLNPLDNPFINRGALMALKFEVDTRTYRIEVLGEFLPASNAVCYNWTRLLDGNERPAPTPKWLKSGAQEPCPDTGLIDVTAEYLRSIDLYDSVTDLAGMDFQVHPHMGGPVYRIFDYPTHVPSEDTITLWGVDELVIQGDEDAWCEHARDRGYHGNTTLIVGDGTGEYQHSRRRDTDSPPPEWRGRGSFDIIRAGGFRQIVRPDPKIPRNNPHVLDRVRALTSLVESAAKRPGAFGRRRLLMDPDKCPLTCRALRAWPTVHGKPSRTHEAAHLGDGASYPVVRLFPRLFRSGNTGQVDPTESTERTPARESSQPRPYRRGSRDRGL